MNDPGLLPLFLRALRDYGSITFVLADDLGHRLLGMANLDTAVIYLSATNTAGEMLATIGHEIAHLAHPEASETEIEHLAATALIPQLEGIRASTTGDVRTVAQRCGVDEQLVRARIRGNPFAAHDEEDARGVG